ncbi:MAG: sigma-70 family RNA polymerase sigma factor [Burkholderiales bacterium]|nr:sigma-70 family RNA polymerase sigma factor [Burkholderiales bacterium]
MLGTQDLDATAQRAGSEADREEITLLAHVRAGELRAFDTLYRLYFPRLARFIERMTRRPALVEELINDTMMVVWRRADSYNGESKVSTWIFGIAYRKALKALSKVDDPVDDSDVVEVEEDAPGPEATLTQAQLRATLMQAMSKLSADHRAVIDLAYFNEFGCREIADIMACPVDTVKTRMFHARRRLKTVLGGTAEDWI